MHNSLKRGDRFLNPLASFVYMKLTAIIKKGERQYVALCPEVDVVSQGKTIEEAVSNLKEAVELHIDVMGIPEGVGNEDALVTSIEVRHGKAAQLVG